MSSPKQIEANRRNALKSTGPTTPEGKERSRCNAIRHGLTAETVITAFEDAEDYQVFEAAVIADYQAETAVERELVLRLASVLWRLRRATGIETALFDFISEKSSAQNEHLATLPDLANIFLRLAALPTCPLDRLSRYEFMLWRQAHRIVFTLEDLRRHGDAPRRTRFSFPFSGRNNVSGIVR
jgi:hypothetical protein